MMKSIMFKVGHVLTFALLFPITACKFNTEKDSGALKEPPSLNSNGESKGETIYSFDTAPVPFERGGLTFLKLPNGETYGPRWFCRLN